MIAMSLFVKKYAVYILLVLGFATRFAWIWYPPNVVWDEQHFCNFTKGYLDHKYFFDIHPPLGKLILLGGLKTFGANTENLDCAIGSAYPKDYPYTSSRIFPAVAGSLLPAIIYGVGKGLSISPAASFFAAAFVLLDNAILADSHFGLIDMFVPFFGFSALLFFLLHRKQEPYGTAWWGWLLGSAVCAALTVGTKWTGGGMLLVMGVITVMEAVSRKSFALFLARMGVIGVAVVTVYVLLFAAHFRLLPLSGPGDAFMSERFRVSLSGSPEQKKGLEPLPFFEKFVEVNKKMFNVNAAQDLKHQDSSRFYEWPVGRKRIYFWVDKLDGMKRIFLLANPVVWLFAAIAFYGSILYLIFRREALQALVQKNAHWRQRIYALEVLLLAYFANYLPFIAISRAMFLYHYFSSLIASLLIGSFIVFDLVPTLEQRSGNTAKTPSENKYAYWILLALALAAFALFSPLSYGYKPFFK